MLYCLWYWQFEQMARKSRSKVELRDAAKALSDKDARESVIGSLIPSHGLDNLKTSFKELTGKSLPEELNTHTPKLWDQINTAFEVRHLVEHCDGKVDQKFIGKVQWKQSSWCDFPVRDQAKIEVRRKDFEKTCEAMVQAAKLITDLTSDC
jgi:hypothetical protein